MESFDVSPNGQWIASGLDSGAIKIWDVATGTCIGELQGHHQCVHFVVFSPDGRWIASSSFDSSIKIWDSNTRNCQQTLKTENSEKPISSLAFSSDSQFFASNSRNNTITIWDITKDVIESCLTLAGHSDRIMSVVFSPVSRCLFSCSQDGTIKKWDMGKGVCARTVNVTAKPKWGNSLKLSISPNGQRLAVTDEYQGVITDKNKGVITIFEAAELTITQSLRGHKCGSLCVSFSPDGSRIASCSIEEIKLWDAETGKCLYTLAEPTISVMFSPDSLQLVSQGFGNVIKLWDIATLSNTEKNESYGLYQTTIQLSHDGHLAASSWRDNKITIWDVATGSPTRTLQEHNSPIYSISFSFDGSRLASCHDSECKIWDVQAGQCLQTLGLPRFGMVKTTFSPDGQWLAVSNTEYVIIFNGDNRADEGTLRRTTEGVHLGTFISDNPFLATAFTPDNQRLVSGKRRYYAERTGACPQEFGPVRFHRRALFSPDSQRLAIGMDRNEIKIWDLSAHTWQETFYLEHEHDCFVFDKTHNGHVGPDAAYPNMTSPHGERYYLPPASSLRPSSPSYMLSPDAKWIWKDGCNFLYIPEEYRPETAIAKDKTIMLGYEFRNVLFIRFF